MQALNHMLFTFEMQTIEGGHAMTAIFGEN
jgi:hypothetical protein